MHAFRAFFLHHRRLAAVLVAAALCLKALVPAGYMIGSDARTLTVQICADSLGHAVTKQVIIPQSGQPADSHTSGSDSHCPFMVLGHCFLGGADPVQLALALLFVIALGFAPLVPASPRRVYHLRPPLRGPPSPA